MDLTERLRSLTDPIQDLLLRLSSREKVLLVIAVVAVVASLYVVNRVLPSMTELARLEEAIQSHATSAQSTRLPERPERELEAVNQLILAAEQELAALNLQLEPLESRFVAAESPEAVQGVMVSISALAARAGVFIRESVPVEENRGRIPSEKADSLNQRLIGGAPYSRPAKKLLIEGSYFGVVKFLQELSNLPKRIVLLSFSITARNAGDSGGERSWLECRLRIAL